MEGAQATQAVLTPRPRLQLELVQALEEKLSATDVAGFIGQLLLLGGLAWWLPKWAFIGVVLLGLLLARLLGWNFKSPPTPRQQLGRLLVFQDRVVLEIASQVLSYPLDATTRIQVHYQGYQDESLGGRQRASGIRNIIQLNDDPKYAFDVPSEGVQLALRQELRNWYERKVQLKEYRRGNRTVLLTPDLSDEQVQQYQREFGIKLYH